MNIRFEHFFSDADRCCLEVRGLGSFEGLWQLEADWFEAPNDDRQGFSGVVTCDLLDALSIERRVFIKRQENHCSRTLWHPFRGVPTFYKEYQGLLTFQQAGIATVEPLYFGWAQAGSRQRAILVTWALDGWQSLDQWYVASSTAPQRSTLLDALARLLASMHNQGFLYGCLYAKHLFIRQLAIEGDYDIRLLDLENLRRTRWQQRAVVRDLDQLLRSCHFMPEEDQDQLLTRYFAHTGWAAKKQARVRTTLKHRIRHKKIRKSV